MFTSKLSVCDTPLLVAQVGCVIRLIATDTCCMSA